MDNIDTSASLAPEPSSRSTVLDAPTSTASGGGRPALSEPGKPESVGDSLRASLDAIKADETKAEDAKPEEPAKAEVKDDKAAKPEAKEPVKAEAKAEPVKDKAEAEQPDKREPPKADAGERENGRDRPSEGRKHQPPARFLTEAKDVWRNTPHAVQREVARMEQDHAQEVERYRTANTEYERLRPFAERAQKGGTDLHTALSRFVAMEDAFRADPSQGFRGLLHNLQMTPQQAVVALTRAYGVTPADLARHISQSPDQYNALVQRQSAPQPQAQQQPHARQADPEVAALREQVQAMQMENVARSIIEPFKRDHPRYDELEGDIEFFLTSGRIPQNLSPAERLKEAYLMADRINPVSNGRASDYADDERLAPAPRVDDLSNGAKSIKSSPGPVHDGEPDQSKKDVRDLLESELRRLKRA